ncbi:MULTISPECIES: deoxyribose-phosphate aldolase [Enterococcaceae]|uniref:deoxyribose-phosphate aldolase n=1 Tax=Enterococcaceae TaxID=81852 RepID=UPI000E4EB89B|nr:MULTISPECIES: deoxyribose-phosphate aldolase [Enterococcaceae]MCI0129684.1 deoxyribose-phosphate aldolase [Vagococcus sp. CY53-2]RGI31845.1 deoxyribose-phosphate aldolase [Melissococcus sp. OM08-11BH]
MNLAKYVDHTLLKPDATREQIKTLCEEAAEYDFASVCVNPFWVSYAAEILADAKAKVCTVIGFPLGANTTETKVFETTNAIENGAEEIDMVINIGALKNKEYDIVEQDIAAVVKASHPKAIVKVIIETCLLTDEEIVKACELSVAANADFVKTSTGFSTGGATPKDVKLMKDTVKDNAFVKASGGVRSKEDAFTMIEMGADRLGTSSGILLVKED